MIRIDISHLFGIFIPSAVQLLHKLSIRASTGSEKLLKVVKNPVTQYFPAGCVKLGTSTTGELVDLKHFLPTLPLDQVPSRMRSLAQN